MYLPESGSVISLYISGYPFPKRGSQDKRKGKMCAEEAWYDTSPDNEEESHSAKKPIT